MGCSKRVATPLVAADLREEDDGAPGSVHPATACAVALLALIAVTAACALAVLL
jgi:hypothetical protein